MPVFSYIAYPVQGAKAQLLDALRALEHCEVTPSDNAEILLLVTDTPDEASERLLQQKLKRIKSLQSLGMAFGHVDL